jgi:hypothetical protein
MKYTALNYMYSTTFGSWAEHAAATYGMVNAVLSQVRGKSMESHRRAGDVVWVTYDGGPVIEIDYGKGAARVIP